MSIDNVIENAETCADEWRDFEAANPDKAERFRQFYHLRPTSKGVTIVTTHPDFPMRGIHTANSKLAAALEIVAAAARPSDVIIGSGEKFKQGFQNKEFPLQAKFINDLTRDGSTVCTRLGVNKLYFVASELILQEVETSGGDKIDVVAADEKGNVFFFEMKSEQNKKDNPVAQVARYIERYGKNGHRNDEFEKLLRNYPIHSVSKIDKYSGIVVIGDENGYEIRQLEKIDE